MNNLREIDWRADSTNMEAMTTEVAEYICKHISKFDKKTILTAILTELDNGKLPELRKYGYEDALFIWMACELENLMINRRDNEMKITLDAGASDGRGT